MLHLLPLEEAQSAVYAIRDRGTEERMLEHARLGIGAIEHRDLAEGHAVGLEGRDLIDDERGFLEVRACFEHAQRLAFAFGGPQILAEAPAVVADERIRRVEDAAVRAIVLLELDHAFDAEIALKVLHVRAGRAAEGVDRLVVVTDGEDAVSGAGQQLEPAVLKAVRVLELVDQDVLEATAVVLAQGLVARKKLVRAQQKLREIDHAFALALLVVGGIHLDQPARDLVVRLGILRAPTLVLVPRDEPRSLARRIALLVEVHALHDALHHRELVLRIEDLEELRQPGIPVMHAQHPIAEAMERAHPHAARVDRQHRRDAGEHLARGLVRERDREEPVRTHLPGLDEPRDARREHARLAAARAGENQRGLRRQGDGFELFGVEAFEELRRHAARRGETARL